MDDSVELAGLGQVQEIACDRLHDLSCEARKRKGATKGALPSY
jgi:hypothetical protein